MTGASFGFVSGFVRWVFSDVSFVTRWRRSKIAGVLKFEHFIAPAGPSRVETSSKQLQTRGFGSDVGLQNLYRDKRGRRGMIAAASTHSGGEMLDPHWPLVLSVLCGLCVGICSHLKVLHANYTLYLISKTLCHVFTFIPQGGAHLKRLQAW